MRTTRTSRAKAGARRLETAVGGREKLIHAVVELGARTRSIASLGLREVARAAGLNPNTFYRHFASFDELGLAVIDKLSAELRSGLRALRVTRAARGIDALPAIVHESVLLTFEFMLEHRAACVIGIRELHGSSPILRKAMRRTVDDIASEMTEDVVRLLAVPQVDTSTVHEISRLVIRQMCFLGLDYMEYPDQRPALRREAERFVMLLVWGTLAANAPHVLAGAKLKLPE